MQLLRGQSYWMILENIPQKFALSELKTRIIVASMNVSDSLWKAR